MKSSVVGMLYDARDFISGEEISRRLSVSRAAVWKVIRSLKADGADIEASPHKGYRLNSLPDLLKPEYLNVYLKNQREVLWFEEIDSTNNYLKDLAPKTGISDIVAIAENQTGGKGRLGRSWASNAGQAIQMSFLIRPDIAPIAAGTYNFAAALSVCSAIKSVCGIDARIKWPNDVIYDDKKLCGILTEMSTDMDRIEYIVCGIGTNVNQPGFDGELTDRAVSLKIIAGRNIDRLLLCAAQINAVFEYFEVIKSGDSNKLMEEYKSKSAILGRTVRITDAKTDITGECVGFGDMGELLLQTGGGVCAFHAGEVTLRGVDGYV